MKTELSMQVVVTVATHREVGLRQNLDIFGKKSSRSTCVVTRKERVMKIDASSTKKVSKWVDRKVSKRFGREKRPRCRVGETEAGFDWDLSMAPKKSSKVWLMKQKDAKMIYIKKTVEKPTNK